MSGNEFVPILFTINFWKHLKNRSFNQICLNWPKQRYLPSSHSFLLLLPLLFCFTFDILSSFIFLFHLCPVGLSFVRPSTSHLFTLARLAHLRLSVAIVRCPPFYLAPGASATEETLLFHRNRAVPKLFTITGYSVPLSRLIIQGALNS